MQRFVPPRSTRLAIRPADIPPEQWPEAQSLKAATFIEVGWGDAAYYQSPFINPVVVATAAFLPTKSAIHVAAIQQPLEQFFPESEIVQISLNRRQMQKLCRFIRDSYARDEGGDPQYLGPAIYGRGGFYRANGYYYLPKTCNVWTAKALEAAGCPVLVPLCTLAQPLVLQTKPFADHVQTASPLPVIYPFINFDRSPRD